MMFLFLLVISVPISLLEGLVGRSLWGWFIVPVFHLPPLRLVESIGISMLVNFWSRQDVRPWPDEDGWEPAVRAVTVSLWVWLIGWIVQFWMAK